MKKIIVAILLIGSLSGCGPKDIRPDLGSAPPAAVPKLPATFAEKAKALPPMVDPSLGGVHRDGVEADKAYNGLAFRYNALVDAWDCVKDALANRKTDSLDGCFKAAEPQ